MLPNIPEAVAAAPIAAPPITARRDIPVSLRSSDMFDFLSMIT
jgi:hypothetical protein